MRIIKSIIALITLLIMTCSFGCSEQKNEKVEFNGKLSQTAFATAEEAAEAYYNEQIKGGEYEKCGFGSYTFKKELSKSDVGELDLGELTETDVISAERGVVNVTYGSDVFKNKVYIIQTKDGYHYYSIAPTDEEAVCSDYYEYLISEDVLSNVTIRTNAIIIIEEEGYSSQTEIIIEHAYDGENIKFDVVIKNFFNGGINEISLGGYIVIGEDDFAVYGLNEKEEYVDITREYTALFSSENKSEVYTINQIVSVYGYGQNLFKVNDKTFVLRNIEEENLSAYFNSIYYGEDAGEVNSLSYTMMVKSHRISSISANIHSTDSTSTQDLYISIETNFTKYGETKTEIPEEISTLWNE